MASPAVLLSAAPPSRSSRRRRSPSEMTPQKPAVLLHRSDAELFRRHFEDDIGHGRGRRDGGDVLAGVHQLAHFGELLAELAAGMQFGEIFGAEALAQTDGDGQRIAEREHGGGGGGGREIQTAGFALDRAIEGHVARLRQSRLQIAREADERVAFALDGGEQAQNFLGFSAEPRGR